MGIGSREARSMSLWEYEARLYCWNEAHKTEGRDEIKSDPEKMERLIDKLKDQPDLLSAKPKAANLVSPEDSD